MIELKPNDYNFDPGGSEAGGRANDGVGHGSTDTARTTKNLAGLNVD